MEHAVWGQGHDRYQVGEAGAREEGGFGRGGRMQGRAWQRSGDAWSARLLRLMAGAATSAAARTWCSTIQELSSSSSSSGSSGAAGCSRGRLAQLRHRPRRLLRHARWWLRPWKSRQARCTPATGRRCGGAGRRLRCAAGCCWHCTRLHCCLRCMARLLDYTHPNARPYSPCALPSVVPRRSCCTCC